MGIRGTLPPLDTYGATGGAPAAISLPGLVNTIFVDTAPVTGAEDGTIQNPYHSLDDALTAAAAAGPDVDNPVVIYLFPGRYNDDGMSSVDYVRIVGASRGSVVIYSNAKILSIDDIHTSYWNLTFEVTANVVSVEVNAAAGGQIEFHECGFVSFGGTSSYVDVILNSEVLFKDCVFYLGAGASVALNVDGTDPTVYVDGCRVEGDINHKDGQLFVKHSEITGGGIVQNSGPDELVVEDCRITNPAGHAITFAFSNVVKPIIKDCILEASAGSYDLYVSIPIVAIASSVNNLMTRGISQNVGLTNERVSVGQSGDYDFYNSLYDATRMNPDTRNLIVDVLKDTVETTIITPQAEKVTIRLHGHKVSRAGRALLFNITTAGTEIVIEGPGELEAGIDIGSSGNLTLHDLYMDGPLQQLAGHSGHIEVDCSTIAPETSSILQYAAIQVASATGTVSIKHSYLKGVPGGNRPAVRWATNTNNGIGIRHSTLLNGDLTNEAFGRSAAQTPNIAVHHCADLAAMPAWLTNTIAAGQEFITIDGNVVFN